ESPVGTLYINRRCTKLVKDEMRAVLETRFLRKPGQAEFSGSGKLTIGQFESSTRLELLQPDIAAEGAAAIRECVRPAGWLPRDRRYRASRRSALRAADERL